jgi:hypothetical protein
VRDFIGILLVNAGEGQAGEALGLSLVEIGICHERSKGSGEKSEAAKPGHECMVAER